MSGNGRMSLRTIGALTAVTLCLLAVALRPHVAEHWALYLGAPGAGTLFLDPFPDRASCEARVTVFAANRERAFCGARFDVEAGGAEDAVLAADFGFFSPGRFLCVPRRHDSRGSTP